MSTTRPVGRMSTSTPLCVSAYTPLLPGGWLGRLGACSTSTNALAACSLSFTGRGVSVTAAPLPPALAPPARARLGCCCGAQLSDQACVTSHMNMQKRWHLCCCMHCITLAD